MTSETAALSGRHKSQGYSRRSFSANSLIAFNSSELFDSLNSANSMDFVPHSQEDGQSSAPRKRGRPPGSLNKSTLAALMSKDELANEAPPVKRGRGRPLGSKNKPKFNDALVLTGGSATGPTGEPLASQLKRGPGRPKGSKNKPKSPATSSFVRRISFDSPEREGDGADDDSDVEEILPPTGAPNEESQSSTSQWRSQTATTHRPTVTNNREQPSSPAKSVQREPRPQPEDASMQQANDASIASTPVMTPVRMGATIPPEFRIDSTFVLSFDESEDIELNLAPFC